MLKPGPKNLITDVAGIAVGNAHDREARTGVTVVLPDQPAVMAVDLRGGAPGSRDIEALDPACLVAHFHGVVLSGGSVFGLEAASGATQWLSGQGRGITAGPLPLPVVPSAILFDLANGGDKAWGAMPPYRGLGIEACERAGQDFDLGNAGAGYGASAGPLKGGLGSASLVSDDGVAVGALFAVNSYGSTVIPGTNTLWAWTLEQAQELGGQNPPDLSGLRSGLALDADLPDISLIGRNTTIGVVATNMALDKAAAKRVAIMAQDGLARAIRPVHTPFDGDLVFVVSTGARAPENPVVDIARIGMMAADCAARAIARGVYEADSLGDMPGYRQTHRVT